MGAGGWGLGVRVGAPCGRTVAEATASLSGSIHSTSPPPPHLFAHSVPVTANRAAPNGFNRAGLRVPPSFSFQCLRQRISNSFTFNHARLPDPSLPQNSPLFFPLRMQAHHHMGGRLTHLIVGAQLRITICLLGKMGLLLHCVP